MLIDRRTFAAGLAATTVTASTATLVTARPTYRGPNVIIVRFGGGVRRRETVEPGTTFAPYLLNVLAKRGVLIPNVTLAQLDGVDTSHAEGTLNILTGRYGAYRDAGSRFLARLMEPTEPTLFEYLRRTFDVPAHQALLINGEDRPQEEFFSYGVHKSHGIAYRSDVLSLFRFKLWMLNDRLSNQRGTDQDIAATRKQLHKLEQGVYRPDGPAPSREISKFWKHWQQRFGDSGLKNPRGDDALTELAVWALRRLQPRLMMVNYQDPDYVHWGNASHYTRAITRIDRGLERLVSLMDTLPAYRNRTVLVVVPDCGRDANPLMSVPFQHHFNSRSAHEIWALIVGPDVTRGRILDKAVDQTSIAATAAAAMGFTARRAEGRVLDEVFL
ncbi:MAG: hypothetical protein AAF732_07830 [Pseudomonadota bacterium]